ncbi:MAG TPA: hypothetical protein PKO44_08090 [Candidatus Omnitrophota bacterium]|nr:hypothetical protein [Candidatus Omnitrophota bacterium]
MSKLDDPQLHHQIKALGVAMFIPVSLAVGPLTGFFAGRFLMQKYALPVYVLFICIAVGFLASVSETIRVIKFLFKE